MTERHIQCKSGKVFAVPEGKTGDEIALANEEAEYEYIDSRVKLWMDLAFREHFYISPFDLAVDCTSALALYEEDQSIPQWVEVLAEQVFKVGWKHPKKG